ncbi:unnamed protein product [Sympodiomycopsis kandeliae]
MKRPQGQSWLLLPSLLLSAVLAVGTLAAPSYHQKQIHIDVSKSDASGARTLRPDLIGYSIEPTALTNFTANDLTRNLLATLKEAAGGASPPIRIGGNTADQIVIVPEIKNDTHTSTSGESDSNAQITQIDAGWYDLWTKYFSADTDLIYTLNFRNTSDKFATARQEAEYILKGLTKGNLKRIEFGNEIDHYINKKWRSQSWGNGLGEYISQWKQLYSEITGLKHFKAYQPSTPKFQAAVFADPPFVPDQQDEIDDFSIKNLTKAGFTNSHGDISGYAVHLYPQSNCDAVRKARLSLDLLVDHSVIYKNLSQFIPQEKAARTAGGAPLLLGETNSVSCSGKSGISDVFGTSLWMVDYALTAASIGIEQLFFHLGNQSPYSAWFPLPFKTATGNESVEAGIRANYYSHLFLSHVVKPRNDKHSHNHHEHSKMSVKSLTKSTTADWSSFAIYSGEQSLEKVVLIDMGHWNSTKGISNPSTESSTDSKSSSKGARPSRQVQIDTPWKKGSKLQVTRLQGPGINAKSQVTVAGQSVSGQSGRIMGDKKTETVIVGGNGRLDVSIRQAEAVLLSVP